MSQLARWLSPKLNKHLKSRKGLILKAPSLFRTAIQGKQEKRTMLVTLKRLLW
jgi:hypothetical protein